jgi:fumarate reductase subunit D
MTTKRSNAPIFWVLFGAGGALAALVGPILVLVTGIIAPVAYERVPGFAQHWAGKAFLLAVVSLFLWHAAHRIFHSLHDVEIHAGAGTKLLCYGSALFGTAIAAAALIDIGF